MRRCVPFFGANLCFAASVNGLGLITAATVTLNSGNVAAESLNEACARLILGFAPTGPTSGAGMPDLSNVNVNTDYPILPDVVVPGPGGGIRGDDVCVLGVANAAGHFISVTFIRNWSTQLTFCGEIGAYSPASRFSGGLLMLGETVVPLAAGAPLIEGLIVGTSTQCVNLALNAYGRVIRGFVLVPLAAYPVYGPSTPGGICPGMVLPI